MRWQVEVTYLDGSKPLLFEVEELSELQVRIEQGKDFREIDRITVRYRTTVMRERAAALARLG